MGSVPLTLMNYLYTQTDVEGVCIIIHKDIKGAIPLDIDSKRHKWVYGVQVPSL